MVRELRPRVVVLENVAALLTRGLDRVLGTLAEIGFDAEWDCLPASAFGASHERQRLFLTAYARGVRVPRQIEGKSTSRNGQGWPCGQVDLQAILESPFDECGGWPKPLLRRGVDGFSSWVDRIRCLGNAVVPQVAEHIGVNLIESLQGFHG